MTHEERLEEAKKAIDLVGDDQTVGLDVVYESLTELEGQIQSRMEALHEEIAAESPD